MQTSFAIVQLQCKYTGLITEHHCDSDEEVANTICDHDYRTISVEYASPPKKPEFEKYASQPVTQRKAYSQPSKS